MRTTTREDRVLYGPASGEKSGSPWARLRGKERVSMGPPQGKRAGFRGSASGEKGGFCMGPPQWKRDLTVNLIRIVILARE